MKTTSRIVGTMLVSALLFPAASAKAATITVFNSEAAWLAALADPATLEDFQDATLADGLTSITGSSVLFPFGGGVLSDQVNDGVGVTSTTFAFDPEILAFGGIFNLAGPGGLGTGIAVDVDFLGGGSQAVGEIPRTLAGSFWGFTSDVPILNVRLSTGTQNACCVDSYNLDNLQFQTAVESVPEPTTLLLLGSGLGLAALRRRLKGRA